MHTVKNIRIVVLLFLLNFLLACKEGEPIISDFENTKVDLVFNGDVSWKINGVPIKTDKGNNDYQEFKKGDALTVDFNVTFKTNDYPEAYLDSLVLEIDGLNGDWDENVNIDSIVKANRKVIYYDEQVETDYTGNFSLEAIFPEFSFISDYSDGRTRTYEDFSYRVTFYAHIDYPKFEKAYSFELFNRVRGILYEPIEFYTFKLYNNYIGKPLDSEKGLGFNFFTREYINQVCEIEQSCKFSVFEGAEYLLDEYSTIMNLTYVDSINDLNSFFNPAFGLLNGNRRNLLTFNKSENIYDWDNRAYLGPPDYTLGGITYLSFIKTPEIGDTYVANYDDEGVWVLLHVLAIVEDAEDSYVEFEVGINQNSQRQYENVLRDNL